MSTPEQAIAIMACLSNLMGDRSIGTATVRSIDATGTLPPGAFCFPVLNGQTDFARPFRFAASYGSDNKLAAATVVQAGTDVPITSVLGGAGNNLPANTPLVWYPANDGIEPISAVGLADMTGGTADASQFAVKSIVWFEEPAGSTLAEDLIRAAVRQAPAVVLSWSRRLPVSKLHGPKQITRTDQWQALIICSRQESHHTRGLQALTIVDLIEAELIDRQGVDGLRISSPPIQLMGVQRVAVGPAFYAYALSFQTSITSVGTDDTKRAAYAAWAKTKFTFETVEADGDPTLAVVDGATYPHS